ncbi:amino acid ABC transporter permease [Hydrogenophaga crassostreae]|uniref:Amino acid ABC transporter permease n=1 Tax=Hydrogenophaga crassostreae TaxID=1763535 RepID=A0A162SPV5_9BURK|nr:ABC transporter permease subunit [Hydrogenophaga crassostreae]AOW11494.1 amino acid ABC transporter permease [Hydrogenophaga crassostreae]OAD39334.1 amino acid ABC transporter permease [Hydrogenophaga crassostreae]
MSLFNDYLALLVESGPAILEGLLITVKLLVGSCLVGFALSVPLAIARLSTHAGIRWCADVYSAVFRGTPLLVQIFIFYYGLSQFEAVRASPAWLVLNDSFYCGLVVLSLNLTAYMAEDIRAGIMAVPNGEKEAALAYGLNKWQLYRYILIPRALTIATPALGNEIIAQLKSTALVSTITVLDLTGVVRRLSATSYTTDALILAGVIYALITLSISWVIRWIERRNAHHFSR